jgi:hypothetical protein
LSRHLLLEKTLLLNESSVRMNPEDEGFISGQIRELKSALKSADLSKYKSIKISVSQYHKKKDGGFLGIGNKSVPSIGIQVTADRKRSSYQDTLYRSDYSPVIIENTLKALKEAISKDTLLSKYYN